MRRLFFVLTVCILFCVYTSLSAQEQGEPRFGDAVEVVRVDRPQLYENVIFDDLVVSNGVTLDDENRAVRTSDGTTYPWPNAFIDSVLFQATNQLDGVLIYQGNVYLYTVDYNGKNPITYWTLNLETGVYTQRPAEIISTFCGDIRPQLLLSDWFFKVDEHESYLCSLARQFISAPLPAGFRWTDFDDRPTLITMSPTGKTIVFVSYGTLDDTYTKMFFRYDLESNTFTALREGFIHPSGGHINWVTDEILVVNSVDQSAIMAYNPVFDVVDLRYNDVTHITGIVNGTPEDQIKLIEDPLSIVVEDIISIGQVDLNTHDTLETGTYCRYTIYNLLQHSYWVVDHGEFCHFVGGNPYGIGYYLKDDQLWRLTPSDGSITAFLMLNDPVNHVSLRDGLLQIYTPDRVWQLDTSDPAAALTVFFDHPAILQVDNIINALLDSPYQYFITAEGVLRFNTQTNEQELLFAGSISRVDWIDEERELASLIYQVIEDNFPPYISPTIYDLDAYDQPGYSMGKPSLVNLKTHTVIFEVDTEWEKLREYYEGFWHSDGIIDWGRGWYQPEDRFQREGSGQIFIVNQSGELVGTYSDHNTHVLTNAEDWLLIHDRDMQTLSLVNPVTGESIFVAENVGTYPDVTYDGNGRFTFRFAGEVRYTTYHFYVSQILP